MIERMLTTIERHALADAHTPVLLMVSGGSDSTALAYAAATLHDQGHLGPLAILHVNHNLRGAASDADATFVCQLAELLHIPFTCCSVDVKSRAAHENGNIEATARHMRYEAAAQALQELCTTANTPLDTGRMFTAHTFDDRMENFYMRSIVGTGPGGFRSMRYKNGHRARPLLDCEREQLQHFIQARAEAGLPVIHDEEGALWRTDATNEQTDGFRTYVRHTMMPLARKRNPQLATTLTRTMNLIADEDDMIANMVDHLEAEHVVVLEEGYLLRPALALQPYPLLRRLAVRICKYLLGGEERIDTATVDALLAGFENGKPKSGYVCNIQGNLAVSANKKGIRVEPMTTFRRRRNKI